ncbi:thermonuclease family protein [filamentous cyanobacterium LEGE 11480]|uniref:Thermonuclease family protein n=2 Tax=Romeriopsis TaxID=2992131 RepID=A0A928VMG2_9CYAN|nr:thermonuclease family protein [Romeriopsis navalis LEGE 11480]
MEKYGTRKLDRDRDGIACEALPKRQRTRHNAIRPVTTTNSYRVVSVGDGDTIRVRRGNNPQSITIRLACIDAPEMRQGIYGEQSSQRLKQLLPIGETVKLRISATDRYGRKVAEIIRNGNHINLQMVREGQAVVYHQYLSGCGLATQHQLVQAEKVAQQKRIGFWQQANPILPKDYRRYQRQR